MPVRQGFRPDACATRHQVKGRLRAYPRTFRMSAKVSGWWTATTRQRALVPHLLCSMRWADRDTSAVDGVHKVQTRVQ